MHGSAGHSGTAIPFVILCIRQLYLRNTAKHARRRRQKDVSAGIRRYPTAVAEYINGPGRSATALGLGKAITEYWQREGSTKEGGSNKEFAEWTPAELMHRRDYKWTDHKEGVYEDGHDRADVLAQHKEVFLPRFPQLIPTFAQ
jgi:hypothetical protein